MQITRKRLIFTHFTKHSCRKPHFEWLLQLSTVRTDFDESCRKPHFEWLLQQRQRFFRRSRSCRKPHFEWLLQPDLIDVAIVKVVESHILSGYYNCLPMKHKASSL